MKYLIAVFLAAAMVIFGACGGDDVEPDPDTDGAIADTEEGDGTDFDTLDLNGDSYLDNDEISEWADDVGTFDEWDEDADSELDPDEIYGNAFEVWDADADGIISEEEWQDSAETWYPADTDVIVFNDVDGDGDSEIDVDEFSERFDFSVLGETWTTDTFDAETFETAYFELYDTDNDGQVSEDEWSTGSATWGTPADV